MPSLETFRCSKLPKMMFVQKIKHLNAKFDIISQSAQAILLISEEGVNNYAATLRRSEQRTSNVYTANSLR